MPDGLESDPSELRAYGGSVERPRPILERRCSYLDSTVTVTRLLFPGMVGPRFEVRVTRHGGPKLEGTPDPVGVRIAQVDDVIAEVNGERAREIALRAADELFAGRIPVLHELQQTVRGAPAPPAEM